jgi:peptidoglycan/xylan/chitin deacetylase (PgdA/CDA1 family)
MPEARSGNVNRYCIAAVELIFKGPSDLCRLALTIDDFPSSGGEDPDGGSLALLALLKELKIPATFFCIGERVAAHPGIAAKAVMDGHELGNHMARDEWSFRLPHEQFINQLDSTATSIHQDLLTHGVQPSPLRWFRPSGGWPTPQMIQWAESHGYRTVLGSIWPFDGLSSPLLSPETRLQLQQEFVQHFAHPGGIIVMHDTTEFNPLTRETLRVVVPSLMANGYTFVGLTELLGSTG